MKPSPTVRVGRVAPETVPAGRHRPHVLAFVRDWSIEREPDVAAIRAELRGLGAVMIVHSDHGVWSFRPDDEIERMAPPDPALARTFGVRDEGVFVIDADGIVRFAHAPAGPLQASLAEALREAGRAVLSPPVTFTRRDWAITCLCAGFAIAFLPGCRKKNNGAKDEAAKDVPREPPPEEIEITLDVNGEPRTLKVEPRVSLLDALRERLALTGTKKGCDAGQCGACTVHIDGKRVLSCLTLAVMAQGRPITTIEGLAQGTDLHPVQKAFIAHDGLQCGYCTPGQIMSAVALLAEGRAKTDDEVREHMSGNLCRCGAYPNIVAAIQAARRGA